MNGKISITIIFLCLAMISQAYANTATQQATTIKIGGLFPLTGALSAGGVERRAAAQMAVDNINANDSLLSGYTLELVVKDTATDPANGEAMAKELAAAGVVGFVGAAASSVSKAIAAVAEQNKIPQISYSSSDPDLSNKTNYPYFMRMISPDPLAKVKALKDFVDNKTKVATIYIPNFGNITEMLQEQGIQVISDNMVHYGTTDFSIQLSNIQKSNADTIVLATFGPLTTDLFKQIDKYNLQNRIWIQLLDTNITNIIYNENGTINQEILDNVNQTIWLNTTYDSQKTKEFLDIWENCNGKDNQTYQGCGGRDPNHFAPFAYDAIYTFAFAIQNIINNNQDYTDGDVLLQELYNSNFQGMTGKVTFNDQGDRNAIIQFNQIIGTQTTTIATWNENTNELVILTQQKTTETSATTTQTTSSQTTTTQQTSIQKSSTKKTALKAILPAIIAIETFKQKKKDKK